MKRGLLIIAICLLFLAPATAALSTDLHLTYNPKETIILKLTGNILEPISQNSLEFKRNNVLLALDFGIVLLDKDYYIWAIAPEEQGNYTLWLKDITTTILGTSKEIDFSQNFSVSGNLTSYNVGPAAILSRSNFSIDIFLFEDSPKEISISFLDDSLITLQPGRNTIDFILDNLYGSNLYHIKIGEYTIPAYIIGPSNSANQYTNPLADVAFYPPFISKSLKKGASFSQAVILKNRGNSTLKNILMDFDENILSVEPSSFTLDAGENRSIEVKILDTINKNLFAVVTAKYSNNSNSLPISLTLSENLVRQSKNASIVILPEFCEEIGAVRCTESENCIGTIQESKQGICCEGICQPKQTDGSSTWIILILFFVLLAVGAYLYYRYKNSPKKTDTTFTEQSVKTNLP